MTIVISLLVIHCRKWKYFSSSFLFLAWRCTSKLLLIFTISSRTHQTNHSIYFNGWRNRSNNNINISMANFILFIWIVFFCEYIRIWRNLPVVKMASKKKVLNDASCLLRFNVLYWCASLFSSNWNQRIKAQFLYSMSKRTLPCDS